MLLATLSLYFHWKLKIDVFWPNHFRSRFLEITFSDFVHGFSDGITNSVGQYSSWMVRRRVPRTCVSLALLQKIFETLLIFNCTDFKWPAAFARFNGLHLGGGVMWKLVLTWILENNIHGEITKIPQAMLKNVFANFIKRLENCLAHHGELLSDIIFKTWWIKTFKCLL